MNFKKSWETIVKIWKNPVWSKVIAAGIIFLIAYLWERYSNYTFEDMYNYFISFLNFKTPVFVFFVIIALYSIVYFLIKIFKKKTDPIWEERVGNFIFKELYEILKNKNLPVQTKGMEFSNRKAPGEDLLTMFYTRSTYFNRGIDLDDNIGDGGYTYGVLAPHLVGYGLIDKIEYNYRNTGKKAIKYQTSEDGYKFYSLIEKIINKKQSTK